MPPTPWSQLRHDLRTPINAIMGYSELLIEDQEDTEASAGLAELTEIQVAGQRLLATINRILSPDQETDSPIELEASKTALRQATRPCLNAILGYCQILLEQNHPTLQVDLQKIQRSTLQLRELLALPDSDLSPPPPASQILVETTPFGTDDLTNPQTITPNQGRILVVDDNSSNRDLLTQQLMRQQYAVDTAIDGRQALQKVETGQYDLILLDIIMPEINGYDVLRQLKSDERWQHIPVIMISALDEMETVVPCIQQGAADYLPKPFNPVLLRARIEACLEQKRLRDQEAVYLQQITDLNEQLKQENLRLGAELDIARQLQQMVLPKPEEIKAVEGLDISAYMEPADEVGGDYYDILCLDGVVTFGIGDVTGHGLESGVLMMMAQTAIRSLSEIREQDSVRFLDTLNRTLYKNIQRMDSQRSLTLAIIHYCNGQVCISGQHEEILVVRNNGDLERIDTINLGMPIGLDIEIGDFIHDHHISLSPGDGLVLYTDGVTEAYNAGQQYGIDRLCNVISQHWQGRAEDVKQAILQDLAIFMEQQRAYDDITVLVLKQTA